MNNEKLEFIRDASLAMMCARLNKGITADSINVGLFTKKANELWNKSKELCEKD